MTDRGRDTSWELTEVRTVLSRAETALDIFQRHQQCTSTDHQHDPDVDRMAYALEQVSDLLCEWRKTGKSIRNMNDVQDELNARRLADPIRGPERTKYPED